MSAVASPPALVRLGLRPEPRRRLFCLPFAGGGAAAYGLWWRSLPADIEVQAALLPGRESRIREQPLDTIAAMVDAVLPSIQAKLDLPYAIFGHSMGGLLAFEIASALERAGGPAPEHLFVSARRSPDEPDPATPMHRLPEFEFLDTMNSRYGAVPDAVRAERELLDLLLPVLRADTHAIETYEPSLERRVRCKVHVFGGLDDRYPTPAQLPNWQRVAEQPIRVRVFAGDHFYLTAQRDALTADIAATWQTAPVEAARA